MFRIEPLAELGDRLRKAYAAAAPFPHVVIDDFLPAEVAGRVLEEFPPPDSPIWLDWRNRAPLHQPKKLGIGHVSRLGAQVPFIQQLLLAFNAYPVINFLERLTGIAGLVPDPHYVGGGLHQILPGGKLAIHSDFSLHPQLKLYRRINLLLYLNRDWQEEYGGYLELWDRKMRQRTASIAPVLNRCVIFNTDRFSFHGHPDPLATPDGVTRKSIALYYYAAEAGDGDVEDRPTLWQARPGETF
jgi:hypothetical protein